MDIWPKGLSGVSENYFTQNTPAFVLKEIEVGKTPQVSGHDAPLDEFVRALLSKNASSGTLKRRLSPT